MSRVQELNDRFWELERQLQGIQRELDGLSRSEKWTYRTVTVYEPALHPSQIPGMRLFFSHDYCMTESRRLVAHERKIYDVPSNRFQSLVSNMVNVFNEMSKAKSSWEQASGQRASSKTDDWRQCVEGWMNQAKLTRRLLG